MNALPTDAKERKTYPMFSGLVAYFPNALAAVSHLSWLGNEQHHPGTPLHWDKSKSSDELDALMRHLTDEEWVHVAWRALANLERKLDAGWQPWEEQQDMSWLQPQCSRMDCAHRGVGEGDAGMDDPPEVGEGLPKLPDGWIYAGRGPLKGCRYEGDRRLGHPDILVCRSREIGDALYWARYGYGYSQTGHYALRRDSEIAKLNGL